MTINPIVIVVLRWRKISNDLYGEEMKGGEI